MWIIFKISGLFFEDYFGDVMGISEFQNDMVLNVILDIIGVNLGGFYGDYDMNELKLFYMYGGQDIGVDQIDLQNESDIVSLLL